ncbi:MAG: hypothetical protein ABUL58_01500 [Steroidobacter sp.]
MRIAEKNFGMMSVYAGAAHTSYAKVLLSQRKYAHAAKEAKISLDILTMKVHPAQQYVASAEYLLATSMVGEHHGNIAESMLRENIARWTRAEAPAWRAARTESVLGAALLQEHKSKEAKEHLIHANEVLSAKDSGAFPDDIAVAHKRLKEFKRCEAEHRLDKCELTI